MTWILLALLAPLCFAVVNKIDEHLINRNPQIGSLAIFSGLFGFVACIVLAIIAFVRGDTLLINSTSVGILLLSGILELIWVVFYLKAFDVNEENSNSENNDASSIVPWFQFIGLFTYIFGWFLLGETLSGTQLWGLALTILGGAVVSIKFGETLSIRWKAMKYMILASLLIALGSVLFKVAAIDEPSFVVSAFWLNLGLGMAGLLLFGLHKTYRRQFTEIIHDTMKAKWLLKFNLLNEALNTSGVLLISAASLMTAVAKVYAINSFQSAFVFLIGIGIMLRKKEKLPSTKNIIQNCIVIVLMVIGAFLLER